MNPSRILISLTIAAMCSAEEPKLPANITSILGKAEAAVVKNRNAYDAANEKSFSDAEKSLRTELEKLTKSGKLDDAILVKKVLETFRDSITSKVDSAAKAESQTDLLGNETDPLLGKWGDGNTVMWDFKPDGTGQHFWGGAIYLFKWVKSDAKYTVTLQGRAPRVLTFVDKNTINIEPGNSIRMK